jgi:acyl-coenzyme A synthetase/AMP-(fatty) acid ligase
VSEFDWAVPSRFNFMRDVVQPLAADPGRRAILYVERSGAVREVAFAEVAAAAARWAGLLRRRGVERGDRVLVLVGKTLDWHPILLATLAAGGIAIPCSEMLRARDLAFRARHSGARLLVADRSAEDEANAMRDLLDEPPPVLFVDEAEALLVREPDTAETEDTAAGDPAFILYTSGTTKDPKGVTHTHGWCFAKRYQAEGWLDAREGDLVWCTAGTGWAKSIWNVLLGPWSRGAAILLHEGGFDPLERLDLLGRLGVTVLCQAPTEYRLMAKLPGLESHDLSRVRHAVSAGEPLNPEVIRAFQEASDLTLHDGYGQTENTLLVGNFPGAEIRPGSMGLPSAGHDMAVVDEDGRRLGAGEEGDVALRGRPPTLFSGYWEQPDATEAVFRGEWYVTGDRASVDDDGYFWFAGRADDVILSAAYRIGPFEVESALLEHPAVAESAVVGKPDPDRGQIVKAFVVLRPGHECGDDLVRALQEHAKRITAPYKYPREIEFVDELPKTRSGKIRRVELRKLEERRAQERAE